MPGRAAWPGPSRLAFAIANEKSDQADGIQLVSLGQSEATVHLDARRVDDHIVDAVMMQEAMEPEAVASGLVAREDFCVLWKAEPRLGASDLAQDRCSVAGGH